MDLNWLPRQGKMIFLSLLYSRCKDTTYVHIHHRLTYYLSRLYQCSHLLPTFPSGYPKVTILGAEQLAIKEGLTFALNSLLPCHLVTLLTDSFTAFQLLSSHHPHAHHTLRFMILTLLTHLSSNGRWMHLPHWHQGKYLGKPGD